MEKKGWEDFGEGTAKWPRKDPKIVSIDMLKEQYNKELVDSIGGPNSTLQLAKITADILEREFEKKCDIEWRTVDGNYRLYVTQKGVPKRSEGQLLVIVTKDHKYNVRLNPYSKYEKHYFLAENMDTNDLMKHFPIINGFLANEQVPSWSVFKKEEYRRKNA